MRNVSSNFIEASLSPVGYANAYIEIGQTRIDASNITDITIQTDICEGGAYTIGSFCTAEASMTIVSDALPNVVTAQPIKIYFGYYIPQTGDYEYVPMGIFYAEPRDVSHKNLLTTIKAHDMSWAMVDSFTTALTYPTSVATVLAEIQTALNLTYGTYGGLAPSSVTVYEAPQGSYRDVLAQMALLMGTSAKFNRSGALDFIKVMPSTPVQDYGAYDYIADNYQLTSNQPMAFGVLTVNYTHEVTTGQGEEQETEEVTDTYTYSAPSGSHGITIDTHNIRSQAETNTLGQSMLGNGISYYGYSATLPGQPQIDLGDTIELTEPLGDTYEFIVLSATHQFNGAMKSTFNAMINDSDPSVEGGNISGSLAEQVSVIANALGRQTRLLADTIAANHAEFNELSANKADIDFANVDTATISTAWVKDLMIQGGLLSQSGTFYDLTGVRINGDLITANTLKADRLLLQGTNGLYYALNVDALGQATASSDPKYQEAIDGKVIVAHSITADELTVNNIVGTGGWINLANGTFYYSDATTGEYISWQNGHLTMDLGANTLVRAYSNGVLVAKSGNTVGALVNANGSFDVVPLTWSGNTPTAGTGSLATFGSTVRIGAIANDVTRAEISSSGFSIIKRGKIGTSTTYTDIQLGHMGYDETSHYPYFTFGQRYNNSTIGAYSVAEGYNTTASGWGAHAEGHTSLASASGAHAEGSLTTISSISYPTKATNTGAHAEGIGSIASGEGSHAEGFRTTASGNYSHSAGARTTASYAEQTVIGRANTAGNYAFIIGNGTYSGNTISTSNALTVDWSGDLKISGYAYINNYLDIKTPKSSSAGGWARGIQFMDASDQPYAYIQSYGGGDTASYLYMGYGAYNGSNLRVLPDGHIQVVSNGLTLSLGAQNTSGIHVYSSDTSKPIFLNTSLQLVSNNDIGSTTYGCGDIYLANTKGLRGKSSGGQDWSLVWTNTSNQCGYGYGSYINSSGTVFYDGNAVYIRSKTNIQIQASSGIFTNHDIVVPNAKSYRSQNSSGTVVTMLYMSSGNVITLGNSSYGTQLYGSTVKSTPMVTSSDIRKKTNINQLGKSTDDVLLGLDTFDFNFKDGEEENDGRLHYGISAQQLKSLLEKEDIDTSKTHIVQEFEDYLQVSYTELIPMLIHLCQTQQKEIDKLKEATYGKQSN